LIVPGHFLKKVMIFGNKRYEPAETLANYKKSK